MKSVVEDLARHQWRSALVRLWVLARDAKTLTGWERQRNPEGFDERVQKLIADLEVGRVPSIDECEARPLELVRAVDSLLWIETAATTFSGVPIKDRSSGEDFWLWRVGTTGRRLTPMNRQAGSTVTWFRHHAIVPILTSQDIRVRVHVAGGGLGIATAQAASTSPTSLGVWVAHFADDCEVHWDRSQNKAGRVRADGIGRARDRSKSIVETLGKAVEAQAKIIVMPELSLDRAMREQVLRFLETVDPASAPFVVVPGSFHEVESGHCFNTAPMVDGVGAEELFKHRKLRVFGNVGVNDESDLAEDIEVGDLFEILVTDVGAFGILICKDFLDANKRVATLLQEVPVDWILVPSYGDKGTLDLHARRAKEVAQVSVGCHVVVANIRNVGIGDGAEHLPGFVHIQNSATPTYVQAPGDLVNVQVEFEPAPHAPAPEKRARASLKRVK